MHGGVTTQAGDGRTKGGVIALLLSLALACGSDGNGPMEPGNGNADIRGSYTATHEITLAIGTIGQTVTCDGSLMITGLSNGQFSGQLSIADCPELGIEASAGPISGTVSGGTVEVDLSEEDLAAFEELFNVLGCVSERTDDAFTGTFTGNVITVTFTADLECEGVAGEVTFTYRIVATRTA